MSGIRMVRMLFQLRCWKRLKEKKKSTFKKDLLKLEAKWLEKLQPYGEKGYHSPKADTKEK